MIRSSIKVLVFLVIQFQGQILCNGQTWSTIDYVYKVRVSLAGKGGVGNNLSTWTNNTNRTSIAFEYSSELGGTAVFISRDSGSSFYPTKLPVYRINYDHLVPVQVGDSTMYIQNKDDQFPTVSWIVRSTNGGVTWDSVFRNGSIELPRYFAPIAMAHDSLIILRCFVIQSNPAYDYSTDGGKHWQDSLHSFHLEDSTYNSFVRGAIPIKIDSAAPGVIYILDPEGATETRDGGRTWQRSPVPSTTTWFRYLTDSVIISTRWSAAQETSLWRSSNNGKTWTSIDTIHFVNSDTAFKARELHMLRRDGNRAMTFRFRSGAVISTTNAGEKWIYRGRTPFYEDAENEFSTHPLYGTVVPLNQNSFAVVPSGSFKPVEMILNYPGGIPLQVSDSVFLVLNGNLGFKTIDHGASWFVWSKEIKGVTAELFGPGMQGQLFEGRRLWWDRDGYLASHAQLDGTGEAVTGGYVLTNTVSLVRKPLGNSHRWFHFSPDRGPWKLNNAISESNQLFPAWGSPSPVLVDVFLYDPELENTPQVTIEISKEEEIREFLRPNLHYIRQLHNGALVVAADSLFTSADTGRTWRTLAARGLPIGANGNLNTVTAICEDLAGTLYVGLSGMTLTRDGDVVGTESGGVWRSRDGGQTFTPLAGFPSPTHILNIACDGLGRVYATTTQRTRTLDAVDKLRQDHDFSAEVYVAKGDTVLQTYSEFYSGPIPPGNRVLRRDQQGAMLCATLNSGLLRTINAGLNWTKVGGDELDTVRINDVVVGRNNELYIGTTRGVMYSNAFATSVEETQGDDDDMSRRTTVWCYPTPTTSTLRIRLNNMDLLQGTRPRLTIMTLVGEEAMDLTDQAVRSLGSQRTEFDLDVSALPRGVYGLALQAGKNSSFMKVMVSR